MIVTGSEPIDLARRAVASSMRPFAFTGAGMSSDSGMKTFRGADGLWRDRRAVELATPEALEAEPLLVWEWYRERLASLEGVVPHAGYAALVAFERRRGSLPVITQNIDGLHSVSGSGDVMELHGSIRRVSCTREPWRVFDLTPDMLADLPPRCGCGAVLRPDVVLFGEELPGGILSRAFETAGGSDLVLVVGTSMAVYPAASIPLAAAAAGAAVIEVNPEPTPLTGLDGVVTILLGAAEALPRILGE